MARKMTETIKVLIVDDHPLAREGLRTMLGTAPDIEVIAEAADGAEAIEKANEHHPHMVLMDVRMPNLDGIEATRRIKSQLPSTAVIMLTAYDNDAYIVDAVRAGAGGYLLKDTSKDLLIHTIRAVNSGGMLIKSSLLREVIASLSDAISSQLKAHVSRGSAAVEVTPRERGVLRLVAQGKTNREIGKILGISEDTAKKHVQNIIQKLGVSDRTQAVVRAMQLGIIQLLPSYEQGLDT